MRDTCVFMPMKVEALVLDDTVGGGAAMRRWKFGYRKMDDFQTAEPDALGNNSEIKERGIWLRWVLPRELRTEREQGGFPLIPNRWLITRIAEETGEVTAVVLESDCPTSACMPDEGKDSYDRILPYTSPYLIGEEVLQAFCGSSDPFRRDAYSRKADAEGCYYVNLGIPFSLRDWEEREENCMFLTACAPGNPNFTGYVQYNSNMLSYFDDLKETAASTFHYSVIGWYSQKDRREIFCSGQVFSVPWNRLGFPVSGGQERYRDELQEVISSGTLNAAVGETCAAAFRAYLLNRISYGRNLSGEEMGKLSLLLSALKEGCPDWLEEAAGLLRLRDSLHGDQFEEQYGGTRETEEFDREVRILNSMREELMDAWWKKGYLEKNPDVKTGRKAKEYEACFNPEDKDSLLSRTIVQLEKVKLLYRYLPERENQDAAQSGSGGGGDGGENKENGRLLGRFWRKENPYILVSGLEGAKDLEQDETAVRSREELLSAEDATIEVPGMEKLPLDTAGLLREAFLILDRVYRKEKSYKGKLPDYPVEAWRQPWRPAFMEWRVDFEELPMDGRDQEAFFFDGYDYQLPEGKAPDPGRRRGFGGISGLDPHQKLLFAGQLEKLAEKTGEEEFTALAGQVKSWKLLGQELVNLQDAMAQRDYRTFRRPYGEKIKGCPYTLDEILGFRSEDEAFFERTGGRIESVPLTNAHIIPPYRYTRTGKMHLSDLIFYDAFGRTLNVICSGEEQGLYQSRNFPLIIPDSMKERQGSRDNGFLLKPGLLQFARLSLSFISQSSSPVLGCLILNRLTHSLSLYTPYGEALGDLMLTAAESGERRVTFLPFYDVDENRLTQVYHKWEALGKFVEAQKGKTEAEFLAFLDVADKAFWTMDAAGGNTDERAALAAGRPLVLVQAEAYLEFSGLPRKDAGWKGQGEEILEEVTFPMCLGSLPVQDDGVIGYFADDGFSEFFSMAAPENRVKTVRQRKTGKGGDYLNIGFGKEKAATPYILCDPLLSLYAYTGILPVKPLQLDKKLVLETLKKLEIYFRLGPSPVRPVEQPEAEPAAEPAVRMTKPALPGGVFSWLERKEDTSGFGLYAIQPSQGRQEGSPGMREGYLVFHADEREDAEG